MLRWIRIAISAGALLTIASEAGAAEMGNPYSGGVEQRASDGFTPSLNSAGQKTSNLGSPSQTGAVRDPDVARAVDKLAAATTPGNAAYKIGPLDVLDISVFQAPDLSKTVEVASNGTIDLPLLGETPAAGKSVYELQRELNSKFGAKYLQNPQVTVSVKQFNSSRVTVSGAVKNPGVFPYKGETLLQYITMAGGLTPEANSMVVVLRQQGNGPRLAAKFNIADILAGRADDQAMQAGDLVVADSSAVKKGFNTVLNPILRVLPLAGAGAGLAARP